jgi:membrane protease YdiL (CAAX protease family)
LDPGAEIPLWSVVLLGVAFCASAAAWFGLAWWLQSGRPLPQRLPKSPAPWRATDVAAILAMYVGFLAVAFALVAECVPPEELRPPWIWNVRAANSAHPVALLIERGSVPLLVLCGFAVVVAAPLAEEFLFRLVLLGGLEAAQVRHRRRLPTLSRLLPGGAGPVALSAFVFGMLHFRVAAPPRPWLGYAATIAAAGLAAIATLVAGALWLRIVRRARWADLGLVRPLFWVDVGLGLWSFLACGVPIYALHVGLLLVLPSWIAPDPLSIFLFGVVWGTLYYRTHRLVPSITAHAALNGAMLLLSWLMVARG